MLVRLGKANSISSICLHPTKKERRDGGGGENEKRTKKSMLVIQNLQGKKNFFALAN